MLGKYIQICTRMFTIFQKTTDLQARSLAHHTELSWGRQLHPVRGDYTMYELLLYSGAVPIVSAPLFEHFQFHLLNLYELFLLNFFFVLLKRQQGDPCYQTSQVHDTHSRMAVNSNQLIICKIKSREGKAAIIDFNETRCLF